MTVLYNRYGKLIKDLNSVKYEVLNSGAAKD
jgi:hypothetical protein